MTLSDSITVRFHGAYPRSLVETLQMACMEQSEASMGLPILDSTSVLFQPNGYVDDENQSTYSYLVMLMPP